MIGVLELEQYRSWCPLVKLWAYVDARSPDTCSEWLVHCSGLKNVSRSRGSHTTLVILMEKWRIGASVSIFGQPTERESGNINQEQFGSFPICIWKIKDVLYLTDKELSSILLRTLCNSVRK
jgi:hypothetical protein